jgi:hypothetical protein
MQAKKKNKNPKGFVTEKQHGRNSYSFFLLLKRAVVCLKYLFITPYGSYGSLLLHPSFPVSPAY